MNDKISENICPNCNGTGKVECWHCVIENNKSIPKMYCSCCEGKGFIVCSVCNGKGKITIADFYNAL